MRRLGALLAVVSLIVLGVACGKKQDGDKGASEGKRTAETQVADEPVEMIPDEVPSEAAYLGDLYIRPYFDKDASITELAVTPGEMFDVYVFAEVDPGLRVLGAEYKLVLPETVSMLSSSQTDSAIVTVGRYDVDFLITFRCLPGPRFWIVRYVCKANDDFAGGKIETDKGDNLDFLGFTQCDGTTTLLPATPGQAMLKKK